MSLPDSIYRSETYLVRARLFSASRTRADPLPQPLASAPLMAPIALVGSDLPSATIVRRASSRSRTRVGSDNDWQHAAKLFQRRQPARSPPRNRRATRPRQHAPAHVFDSLPWISQLDVEPHLGGDVTDLSELPLAPEHVGPVRRRRTSTRSSPLRRPSSSPSPSLSSSASEDDDECTDLLSLPPFLNERCTTPPPRLSRHDYSAIRFENLMPQL